MDQRKAFYSTCDGVYYRIILAEGATLSIEPWDSETNTAALTTTGTDGTLNCANPYSAKQKLTFEGEGFCSLDPTAGPRIRWANLGMLALALLILAVPYAFWRRRAVPRGHRGERAASKNS